MSKYGNRRVTLDGYAFDSLAESRRYQELCLLLAAGAICQLEVHPRYELIPKFKDSTGKSHRAIVYEGDFAYLEERKVVVEDVKGHEVPVWKLKQKLFLYKYPEIELRVIRA